MARFLTDTRGTGVINRMFHSYAPHKGPIAGRTNGVLISTGDGEAVAYALWYIEERGKLFIVPGTKVYQGMIIGQHAKDNDLEVNPLKAKQLTNIRTTSKGRAVRLTPIVPMTLEQAIAYIDEDELVEVTPQSIRIRKKQLSPARPQTRLARRGSRLGPADFYAGLAVAGEVEPEHPVHLGLPALALLPIPGKHVLIDADGDALLAGTMEQADPVRLFESSSVISGMSLVSISSSGILSTASSCLRISASNLGLPFIRTTFAGRDFARRDDADDFGVTFFFERV